MSFFIRNKGKSKFNGTRKGKHSGIAHNKKRKLNERNQYDFENNEEITSSEDEEEDVNKKFASKFIEEDEDVETPQDVKLKLAKKYLDEIEKEERERRENDEIDDDVILNRLKNDVLEGEGKLRKTVADTIIVSSLPDDIKILSCSKDGCIVKWSLSSWQRVEFIPPSHKNKSNENLHSSAIVALAVSQDSSHLASSDKGNVIRIWDGTTLKYLFSFSGHRDTVSGLAFCRFSKNLYSSSYDKTIRIWSIPERAYIESLFGHQCPITSIDSLAQDRVISSGGTDNTVRLWKIQEESHLIFNSNLRNIDCVRRLNEKVYISSGEDGCICIWSIMKKKPLYTIHNAHGIDVASGEPNWISSIGTLTNTEIFASGSVNGFVKIWKCTDNFKSAEVFMEIPVTGFVNSIAFSPNEQHLVLGIGQEHRLGRWQRIKEARNSVQIIDIKKKR